MVHFSTVDKSPSGHKEKLFHSWLSRGWNSISNTFSEMLHSPTVLSTKCNLLTKITNAPQKLVNCALFVIVKIMFREWGLLCAVCFSVSKNNMHTISPALLSSKRSFSQPFKERSISEVVRIGSIIIFHLISYGSPSSPYRVMYYLWLGCRGNVKLITFGSKRVIVSLSLCSHCFNYCLLLFWGSCSCELLCFSLKHLDCYVNSLLSKTVVIPTFCQPHYC